MGRIITRPRTQPAADALLPGGRKTRIPAHAIDPAGAKLVWQPHNGLYGRDAVSGVASTVYAGSSASRIWAPTGAGVSLTNTNLRIGDFVDLSSGFCITLVFDLHTIDAWGGIFSIPSQDGAGNYLTLQQSSSNGYMRCYYGSGQFDIPSLTTNLLTGGVVTLTMSNDGGDYTWFIVNGEILTSAYHYPISPTGISPFPGIYLCSTRARNTTGADGNYFYCSVFGKKEPDEALKINRAVYHGLKPANDAPYILSVPGASGPTIDSITMSNVQQTTATATVAVTV